MMEICGIDAQTAAALVGDIPDASGLILPENLRPVIDLAMAAKGQWRTIGGGLAGAVPTCLDVTALDTTARWLGIAIDREMLMDLQVIENEALLIFQDR